jgi:5-methylcytosine-specific restriction enzyme subunit McrC
VTTLTVFEHEKLHVGRDGFRQAHFDALARWKEKTDHPALTLGFRSVRVGHWVGVLCANGLTLEILPKLADPGDGQDRSREGLTKTWKGILFDMLRQARGFELPLALPGQVDLQEHTLLDLFFLGFVQEAEELLRQGLVRTYLPTAANRGAVKGRILVAEDLRTNLFRRDRVFTQALEFHCRNPWNQSLYLALLEVARWGRSAMIRTRARKGLLSFADWERPRLAPDWFERLRFDRRTERYRTVLCYVRQILAHRSPDLKGGREDVLAILFDMNRLWEGWVASRLQAHLRHMPGARLQLQTHSTFWKAEGHRTRGIRPDLVVEVPQELPASDGWPTFQGRTVLDSKWKNLRGAGPGDADLQQLYTYARKLNCQDAWLVYPTMDASSVYPGQFQGPTTVDGGLCFVHLPM